MYICTNMSLTKQDRKTSVTILTSVTGHRALAGSIGNLYHSFGASSPQKAPRMEGWPIPLSMKGWDPVPLPGLGGCFPLSLITGQGVVAPRGCPKATVLNLWVDPLRGWHIRYPAYQIFTLWFVTVAKLQLWSSNKDNFMVGGHHNMRNIFFF